MVISIRWPRGTIDSDKTWPNHLRRIMNSLTGKKSIAVLVPIVALILLAVSVNPAYAAKISPSNFNNPTVINFDDATAKERIEGLSK